MDKLKEYLVNLAKNRALQLDEEDFFVQDYAGGNFDDAFSLGLEFGSIAEARYILNKFFPDVTYTINEE